MRTTRLQRRHVHRVLAGMVVWVLLGGLPSLALANAIEDAASAIESGRLQFHFPAREGVQGDGHSVRITHSDGTTWRNMRRHESGDWCEVCDLRVTITFRDGDARRLRWRVGGRMDRQRDDIQDLGNVDAAEARDYLMRLVDDSDARVAEEALEAAVLSDAGVPWRELLQVARDDRHTEDVRSTALFWIGQEAQEAVTQELEGVATDELEDLEVRKAAVFALSQRPERQSIPALQRIALEHRDLELRRNALFWLAQMDTPAVADFFEELLTDNEKR